MSRFEPEAIKAQIANLVAERERIDNTIRSLEAALQSIQGVQFRQNELEVSNLKAEGLTLQDAVRQSCNDLIDGITRQRVLRLIENRYPFFKPVSSSVAASLINLAKGPNPTLRIAIEGRGRSPAFYTTEGDTTHKLTADESKELLDRSNIKGSGGWQSLYISLQKNFDKASGNITLTPEQRARIFHYYHCGGGGWQDRTRRVFRRELPHLFVP